MTVTVIGDNAGDDYSGTEDTQIQQIDPTTNLGSLSGLDTSKYGAGDWRNSLIRFSGLSNIASTEIVSAATVSIYRTTGTGVPTVTLKRLLRVWVELQATWNIWSTSNNWTTAGGISNGNDRSATVTDTMTVTNSNGYKTSDGIAQLLSDVQDFIDGTLVNDGWHFERTDAENDATYTFWESSDGTDGKRPYLTVTHAAAGGTAATGEGSLTSSNAYLSGSGVRIINGSGVLQTGNATLTGIGSVGSNISGAGALLSGNAALSGSGVRIINGSGVLQTGNATLTGIGSVGGNISGAGALLSGNAVLSGSGVRIINGSGVLQTGNATLTGIGSVGGNISGAGALLSGNALLSGIGTRKINGSGILYSGIATITGNDNTISPRYEVINMSLSINSALVMTLSDKPTVTH